MMRVKQRGQSMVEYAIVMVLLALAILLVLQVAGISVRDVFCKVIVGLGGSGSICTGKYCEDEFANMDNWQSAGTGGWTVQNGQLCSTKDGEQRIFNRCTLQNGAPSDYTVNVNVATLFQGNGYGVYFRMQDSSSWNGYGFQYDPGYNGFVFRKWVNGYELSKPLAAVQMPKYNWYNQPRKIQVVVQGNTFKAYVDGVLVLTAQDDTYSKGGAAFRTWSSTRSCFDGFSTSPLW